MQDIDELIQTVIGCCYKVHNTLGSGFLENIYEKALFLELQSQHIEVELQYPIKVYYNEEVLGNYYADMLINNCLILELKAVENLSVAHEKQIVNYLTATKIDNGLLVNFGSTSVQVKRKYRKYRKPNPEISSQD